MTRKDKIIYVIILSLGVLVIAIATCLMNFVLAIILYDLELPDTFLLKNYFLNLSQICFTMLMLVAYAVYMFISIPYIIISIVLAVIFIIKYIKFKGKKLFKIVKTVILGVAILVTWIYGLDSIALTSKYEIKVNSKVNEVTNVEVKELLQSELENNQYVYKIIISAGFPDDYYVKIYHKDSGFKIADAFLSHNDYEFVHENSKNITNICNIKALLSILLGNILYIYFIVNILKEYKRISLERI